MRYSLLALVILLAACTGSTPGSETTESPTTGPVETTTTSSAATTTAPPPVTTTSTTTTSTLPPLDPPETADFTTLPMPDEELPHSIWQYVLGDRGLVLAGAVSTTPRDHPNESALWHYDGRSWTRTLMLDVAAPDEYGFVPDITNLIFWDGRYLAFLQGDPTASQATASMLVSEDGKTWTLEHILPIPRAGGSLEGIYPTPESPPWPGAAGIAGVTTTDTEVIAVGWVTTANGSTATIWRSPDGRSWNLTPLPNALWPNEWANEVSVGGSGWLVAGTGPVHSNSLLWFSPDGEEWTPINESFGEDVWWSFSSVASGSGGLVVNATDMGEDFATHAWRSDDGTTWENTGPVDVRWPIDPRTSLTTDGETINRMRLGGDGVLVDRSADGRSWQPLAGFVENIPNEPDYEGPGYRSLVSDGTLSVSRHIADSDYVGASIGVWFDSPISRVVLVEADDTLNVRDGVQAEIIGELDPNAFGIATTGRSDGAAGSLWVEILHDGLRGWVNSFFLTADAGAPGEAELLTELSSFSTSVFESGELIGPYVGPKGLSVVHFDETKRWSRDDDPMNDPIVYLWGSTGCGIDPECAPQATFAEQIAGGFLSAWNDDDRVVAVDTPIAGGNGTPAEFVIPTPFRNFHYVAVHDPGDDPQYAGIDWVTWYVYFDVIDGLPVVAGLSVDMWAP